MIPHALTFDIEDWYQGFLQRNISGWEDFPSHDEKNVYRLLDLLDEQRKKATFFILGKYAEKHRGVIRSIQERGHEIASHGYAHIAIPLQSPPDFRKDVKRSLAVLEEIIGRRIIGHRGARWSLGKNCEWAFDILTEEGIEYDSSVFPTSLHPFGNGESPCSPHMIKVPSGKVICEFPAQVLSFGPVRLPAAGGFYFRAIPLIFSQWALRQSAKRNTSGMVYLHPYDLDPDVPRLKTGIPFRIVRYYHLDKTEQYLRKLLSIYSFSTVESLLPLYRQSVVSNLES